MIDLKIAAGFTEIYPPFVTRRETLLGSAHLPHFDENLYRDEDDDVWLVPTAEPQLVGLHRDETLDAASLPRRYVAYTACFRREHMSAGRDVRGIKRGHQFDKVEMVVHCAPEESPAWLDKMTGLAVEVLEKLELPVRVTDRCTGDLGFTAIRGFDVARGVRRTDGSSLVGLELRLVPIRAFEHPLSARGRGEARARPHPQRVGSGASATDDRDHGELPAQGRLAGDPEGGSLVHGRTREDRAR